MAGLPNSSNALQQWHHLFEAQGGPRTPEASQHLQQLLRLGLPTRKHEDWKYTPLDALLNGRFVADEGASLSAEQRDALALPLGRLAAGVYRWPLSSSAERRSCRQRRGGQCR
ncbi:hypothetical protein LN650_13330 [Klebsiella pneumoniae subsp. pneumoniae]|nr:hypothetical protein [Klebsiella pneumoniae subsp. pneumoniae]